ncbi:MAG: hypothetical protein AAGA30_21025, partial [Planctomycetota bacterium]
TIHRWDNWYDYPGSYWTGKRKSIIDQGEPDTTKYLFHTLFGHHGIFSLTPMWCLSLAGIAVLMVHNPNRMRWLGITNLVLTVVVIGFYVGYVPGHDRNYGGQTSTFRWALWLVPVWLVCMAPVVDWLAISRKGRAVCLFLLVFSAISALYSSANPWIHPWLYEIWEFTGLPK